MLWSVPGSYSDVVPAVPSSTGVADVFAHQDDGTVTAITLVATAGAGGGGVASLPALPYQGTVVQPVLQAQDGSFVGTYYDWQTSKYDMVAFDAGGGVRWTVQNEYPQIALADGGVIAWNNDAGTADIFDQNGNATGMTGDQVQSWTGNMYQYGSVDQFVGVEVLLASSFWALQGGQYSPGVAGYPVDSDTDQRVKGTPLKDGILSESEWAKFKTSNCAKVFGNKDNGLPSMWHDVRYSWDPSMKEVQRALSEERFYDAGQASWANLPLVEVLPAEYRTRYNPKLTIGNYLGNENARAATPVLGAPGPIPLAPGFFTQSNPQVDLIHGVLIHAYAGVSDPQVLRNQYFHSQGLWNDNKGSGNISVWMSTDCTCTAGNPSPPPNIKCKTPNW